MEGYQRGTQGNPRPNQENPYARFAASSESKQADIEANFVDDDDLTKIVDAIMNNQIKSIMTQQLARISALEKENKALKAKVNSLEGGQTHPAHTLATAFVPQRRFGQDAMDLDQPTTSRTFPEPLARSPMPAQPRGVSQVEESKGKGSLTKGFIGDLDLAIVNNSERLVMYIPTSCHSALLDFDAQGCCKLFDIRDNSGAKIIIAHCNKRPGSLSPVRKDVARVIITGNEDVRDKAASMIVDYRVAFLPGNVPMSSPTHGKENTNTGYTTRTGGPAAAPANRYLHCR